MVELTGSAAFPQTLTPFRCPTHVFSSLPSFIVPFRSPALVHVSSSLLFLMISLFISRASLVVIFCLMLSVGVDGISFSDPQTTGDLDTVYGDLDATVFGNSVFVVYRSGTGPPSTVLWISSANGISFGSAGGRVANVLTNNDPELVVLNGFLYCIYIASNNSYLAYTQYIPTSSSWSAVTYFTSVSIPTNSLSVGMFGGKVQVTYCGTGYQCYIVPLTQTSGTGALTYSSTISITSGLKWTLPATSVTTLHNSAFLLTTVDSGYGYPDVFQSTTPSVGSSFTGVFGSTTPTTNLVGVGGYYSAVLFNPANSTTDNCDIILTTYYNGTNVLNYFFYLTYPISAIQPGVAISTPSYKSLSSKSTPSAVVLSNFLHIYYVDYTTNFVKVVVATS